MVSKAYRASLLRWCLAGFTKTGSSYGLEFVDATTTSYTRLNDLDSSCTRKILVQSLYFSDGENEVQRCSCYPVEVQKVKATYPQVFSLLAP